MKKRWIYSILIGIVVLAFVLIGFEKTMLTGSDIKIIPKTTCTDSDGGQKSGIKGMVTVGGVSAGIVTTYDTCQGSNVLEASCSPLGQRRLTLLSCGSSTCTGGSCSGKECYDGACTFYTCTDSDGGQKSGIKGITTISGPEGIVGSQKDVCIGELSVYEGTCISAKLLDMNTVSCEPGEICRDGACVPQTCTDSDGGRVPRERGKVTLTVAERIVTVEDWCIGNYVMEQFCGGIGATELMVNSMSCQINEVCYNGACVPQICTDSDGGVDPSIKGTVVVSGPHGIGSSEDWCSGSSGVYERYCYGNTPALKLVSCASGTCVDGACSR